MRLLVVSDTHGDSANLISLLRVIGSSVDGLIHLGDGSGDIDTAARYGSPMPTAWCVRGNIDSDWSVPPSRRIQAGSQTILAAHGQLHLGDSWQPFVSAAKKQGAQAFFFGHTHVPFLKWMDGVLLLNPGSLSRPRGIWGPSFAVVETPATEGSRFRVRLYELTGSSSRPRFVVIHPEALS
ncbi:MAG: YfcE family phosphodiesterase [Spirochaetota bacterium]